jgi:hypothetical protein
MGVCFGGTNLSGAKFAGAELAGVDFSSANLSNADFSSAVFEGYVLLQRAVLLGAKFGDADLSGAQFLSSLIVGCDLSQCRGLETAAHLGPSGVGVDTLMLSYEGSGDKSTRHLAAFFYGAGVPKELLKELRRIFSTIKYHRCFITGNRTRRWQTDCETISPIGGCRAGSTPWIRPRAGASGRKWSREDWKRTGCSCCARANPCYATGSSRRLNAK